MHSAPGLQGQPHAEPKPIGRPADSCLHAPPLPRLCSALGYEDLDVVDPTAGEAHGAQGENLSAVRSRRLQQPCVLRRRWLCAHVLWWCMLPKLP